MKALKLMSCLLVAGILCAGPAPGRAETETILTQITTGPIVEDPDSYWTGAWIDYDNDGDVDLFVGAGADYVLTYNHLYRNEGSGTFTKMQVNDAGDLVNDLGGWGGCTWGDYDNDGDWDVYVCGNYGTNTLYRNNGQGMFARVRDAGPIGTTYVGAQSPTWVDYDNDGLLDLFAASGWVGNAQYPPSRMALYHNEGTGQFNLITNTPMWRYSTSFATQLGTWGDYDDDGDVDLVVSDLSSGRPNLLVFENDGQGGFTQVTTGPIATYNGPGYNMVWGDYDNDGRLDLCVYGNDINGTFFFNEGGNQWTRMDLPGEAGIHSQAWADYDNDGDLDLFASGGQGDPERNRFYINNGDRTFTESLTIAPATFTGHSHDGIWGDYDNDGFMDLYVPNIRTVEASRLYHNEGNNNHWLMVKLVGTLSNRSAIGAKVRARATVFGTTLWQRRDVSGGNRTQNDMRAHFGLGDATQVDILRIEWPSGIVQELSDVSPGQILTLTEPAIGVEPRIVAPSPGSNITLSVVWSNAAPTSYQWRFNGTSIEGATSATLELTNVQPTETGRYTAEMVDGLQRVISQPVQVTVYPVIVSQPQNLTVTNDSPVTFAVVATTLTPPLTYQWRFNGLPLANETSDTLTIPSAQAEHDGSYDVVVSDALASVTSTPARLTVLLRPRITQLVTNYTVVQGGNLTMSIEAEGTLPITYFWRRNLLSIKDRQTNYSHQSFFTLTNVQPTEDHANGTYYVVTLVNSTTPSPGTRSAEIHLTVLPDTDGDGMDNAWEIDHGLNPNDSSDARLDNDSDGHTNKEEYDAGTNPANSISQLKVDRIAVNGEVRVEFLAASNKTYTVQFTNVILPPSTNWPTLSNVVAGPARTVVVTEPASTPQRFYRIVTPRRPND